MSNYFINGEIGTSTGFLGYLNTSQGILYRLTSHCITSNADYSNNTLKARRHIHPCVFGHKDSCIFHSNMQHDIQQHNIISYPPIKNNTIFGFTEYPFSSAYKRKIRSLFADYLSLETLICIEL